jgi:hypothetical protein
MSNIIKSFYFLATLAISLGSCTKFVKVPEPSTQIVRSTVFSDDETATAAALGIYSSMMQTFSMASVNTSLYAGLSADELTAYTNDPALGQFYGNALIPSNPNLAGYWGNSYQYIYGANAILEGLENNSKISEPVKQQLTGEARFIRAFCYFYLANLFGDVPLILSTDYIKNAVAFRTTRNQVFEQIIADLSIAQDSLSDQYLKADNTIMQSRVRPNKWAAKALLARAYLFFGGWSDAIRLSTDVISQTSTYQLSFNLDSAFLTSSPEAIWQLTPVDGQNTNWEAFVYILTDAPSGLLGVSLNSELVKNFEPGDQRRLHWVDSIEVSGFKYYFAYKYKQVSGIPPLEYYSILRLTEQYLIRAEASARVGDLIGASTDLNTIRSKAGLPGITAVDQASLLEAIQKERRFEFFSEWGFRWLDLKRTGTADAILGPIKSPGWKSTDTLYPIPQTELQNDPNLTQNPNY